MLLGNRTVLHKSLCTYRNGTSTAGAYAANAITNFINNGSNRNVFVGENHFDHKNSNPTGYIHPYSYLMPQDEGGMASFNTLYASINETSLNISGGKNVESSLNGNISISNAELGLIVSAIASLAASISTTNAEMAAVIFMVADSLSATGTITPPILGALAGISSSLSALISENASMNDSAGFMSADITPYTELSPENLAAAILNAILADYNDSGTVGEALNNVGASSNPWSSDLSTNNTSGTFGAHVQKLLKLSQYMGLK